jgi:hypothetical protein
MAKKERALLACSLLFTAIADAKLNKCRYPLTPLPFVSALFAVPAQISERPKVTQCRVTFATTAAISTTKTRAW